MKWNFRPSAFNSVTEYANLSVGTLINQYIKDNKRAKEEGVTIHTRSPSCYIRTLQWNVHEWMTAKCDVSSEVTKGFMDTIFNADADIVVLNEYHFGSPEDPEERHIKAFEDKLKYKGYSTFHCGTVYFPTAIATRLHVFETREIDLGHGRCAILFLMGNDANTEESERVLIVGTHLDHQDAGIRRIQMKVLLNSIGEIREDFSFKRVILLGDFNQQRQEDYSRSEWKQISESITKRRASTDDGVSTMLHKAGFKCAWEGLSCQTTDCNWETPKPPSTHWSGTIVDYSYGKGMDSLKVSISPAGWSDHRMTVCDWGLSS